MLPCVGGLRFSALFRRDLPDYPLVSESVPVCQRESLGLGVVNHGAPRRFLILHVHALPFCWNIAHASKC